VLVCFVSVQLLYLWTEGDQVVDIVLLSHAEVLSAGKGRAGIIIWEYIACWASLLEPLKLREDVRNPFGVLVIASGGVGCGRDRKAELIPVHTTTAVRRCVWLVARRSSVALIEIAEGESRVLALRLIAVLITWIYLADGTPCSVAQKVATSGLKVTDAVLDTTGLSTTVVVAVAVTSTVGDNVEQIVWGIEVPVGWSNLSLRTSATWVSTVIRSVTRRRNLCCHGDRKVIAINDLNVIKIGVTLGKSELGLSGWLLEASSKKARSSEVWSAVSRLACSVIAASDSACKRTAEQDVTWVTRIGEDELVSSAIGRQFVVSVTWGRRVPETDSIH